MSGILKVDQILKRDGSTPSAADLGIDISSDVGNVGKVLNVYYAHYSTQMQFTDTAWHDVGLSITLTPTSADSKFLLMWNQQSYLDNYGGWNGYRPRFTRNGTEVYTDPYSISVAMYTNNVMGRDPFSYLDSPNTSSSITYSPQIQRANETSPISLNHSGAYSHFTILEIGA